MSFIPKCDECHELWDIRHYGNAVPDALTPHPPMNGAWLPPGWFYLLGSDDRAESAICSKKCLSTRLTGLIERSRGRIGLKIWQTDWVQLRKELAQ